MDSVHRRLLVSATVVAALLLTCMAVLAQQGAVTFHNFKRYPQGLWQQTHQAYRNGAPIGQPITDTNCTAPASAATAAAARRIGNAAAPQCTTRVITDTERTAEYEQTCDMGGGIQINHVTMRAVDDTTFTNEIHATLGGREIVDTRSTSRYQGTCTAPAMGAMPAMPKPTAADCAEIADTQKQAQNALKSCSTMPAGERMPNCEATMQRLVKQADQAAAACR